MIEITYVHTRVRTTDYIYDVELDGEWVAAACNYSAADRVAQDVEARQQLIACYVCGAPAPHIACNGPLCSYHYSAWAEWKRAQADQDVPPVEQAQARQQVCSQPDNLCDVHDPCPEHAAAAADYIKQQAQIDQGWDYAECPCGAQALYFTQYANGKVYAYCPEHWQEQQQTRQPLLAQCANVIRRCLGRTTGPGGIIDELRRVEAELSREGW
jgi:hypothetical protein